MVWEISNPSEPLGFLDRLTESLQPVVWPLYAVGKRKGYDAHGVGTAFLVRRDGIHFLVTAAHVLDELNAAAQGLGANSGGVMTNVEGVSAPLVQVYFKPDRANDIAATVLPPTWFQANKIGDVSAIDLPDDRPTFSPAGRSLIAGYPGTKNRISIQFGKRDRHLLSVSADPVDVTGVRNIEIAQPIAFEYDPKDVVDRSLGKLQTPPNLDGMSGGPVLDVVVREHVGNAREYAMRLAGVFVEWHRSQRRIIAASRQALDALLDRIIAQATREP